MTITLRRRAFCIRNDDPFSVRDKLPPINCWAVERMRQRHSELWRGFSVHRGGICPPPSKHYSCSLCMCKLVYSTEKTKVVRRKWKISNPVYEFWKVVKLRSDQIMAMSVVCSFLLIPMWLVTAVNSVLFWAGFGRPFQPVHCSAISRSTLRSRSLDFQLAPLSFPFRSHALAITLVTFLQRSKFLSGRTYCRRTILPLLRNTPI